jgi:hypothetical protein
MKAPSALQAHPWRRRFCRAAATWSIAGCLATAWAAGAEPEDLPLIQIEARFFHVTKTQARKAFEDLAGKDEAASVPTPAHSQKALQTLVRMKADIFSNPIFVVRSGQRAVVEAVREMRYPTQFDPAKDKSDRLVPTAFETRNVGVTFEAEAAIKDDQIHLHVVPKMRRFLGFLDMGRHNAGGPFYGPHPMVQALKQEMRDGDAWQPVFDLRQITEDLSVKSGETMLVGELKPGATAREIAPDAPRIYVFITARILPVRNAVAQPQSALP